jgi:hypothetical protein
MADQNTGENTKKRGNIKNLRPPWQPGQSGNPGGRPKKTLLTDAYRAQLAMPYPGDRKKRTYAQVIAEKIAKEAAKKGSVYAASEIADRTEGRPPQALEVGGLNGEPIHVDIEGLTNEGLDAEIRNALQVIGLGATIAGSAPRAKAKARRAAKGKGKKAGS